MRAAILLFSASLIAGCASLGSSEADLYFVLEAAPGPEGAKHSTVTVHVKPTSVSNFYDTQDIVFSRAPGTRAYYQFNHWTERPQHAIYAQLASLFAAGNPGSGLVLNTYLEEIYHDAAQPPGLARIQINAELIDSKGEVLARRRFSLSAPAAAYDAPGAVRGFRLALSALLDDVVAWVDAAVPPTAR